MQMSGLAELWEGWEVEILLVSSLLVQVLLLMVTELRRLLSWDRVSGVLYGIVWVLYQLADFIAIYILGHLSLRSRQHSQQQLMAFWASLLLVHLGGQDTITAYSMEDNDLWLRHLFTLVVQAAGAAYVLYKYVAGGSGPFLAAAVLMFLVGVSKYWERIRALRSSSLDSIREGGKAFELPDSALDRDYPVQAYSDDPEDVLLEAHELFNVCMGQFVDYKVWPSHYQTAAISVHHKRTNRDGSGAGWSNLVQLVGMQLSLMRDILYTKAAVIHTRYGFLSRIVCTVSTVVAFYLFRRATMVAPAGSGYSRGDMIVSYILLGGAFFLELVSLLRAALSTWTCAWLQVAGWSRLHAAILHLRLGVKAAQRCRRWSGSIRQHDLWHRYNGVPFTDSVVVISHDVEDLLLREAQRVVEACACGLQNDAELTLGAWGTAGAGAAAGFYQGITGVDDLGFDGIILAWHYATDVLLHYFDLCCTEPIPRKPLARVPNMDQSVQAMSSQVKERLQSLARATQTLSRYMMFLLADRPHLLLSAVHRSKYKSFCKEYKVFTVLESRKDVPQVLRPAVQLAQNILAKCEVEDIAEVLRVVSVVWVEMLCYAASHCRNDTHARQLSSSTEFLTVTWILMTILHNWFHREEPQFLLNGRDFLLDHAKLDY